MHKFMSMSRKIKKIICLTLLLITYAEAKTSIAYDCPYLAAALTCDSRCKPTLFPYSYTFKINKDDKSVMEIGYLDGIINSTNTLKNCTIFDPLSWDCSHTDEIRSLGVAFVYTKKMINGIYINNTEEIWANNNRPSKRSPVCAK